MSNNRTLRSSKEKTTNKDMDGSSETASETSERSLASTERTLDYEEETEVRDNSPRPRVSELERAMVTMAKLMVDNQTREEKRLREIERKEEQREKAREERARNERREREEREQNERKEREDREARRLKEKEERDERRKLEEEKREMEAEKKQRQVEKFQFEQLELMRNIKKDEDERQQQYQQEQRRWREKVETDKARESKIANALRAFPKITSYAVLPAQLANYDHLLTGLEASEETKRNRLPEVLSGAPAMTFQNMAKGEGSFKELRSNFLSAAGITFASAGKNFIKPDLDALRKLSAVDLWSNLKGMVDRILSGATTVEEAGSCMCMSFLNVFGSNNLIMGLANCSQLKEDDIQQALYHTQEAFGQVLGWEKRFVPKQSQQSSIKCDQCGRLGHKGSECRSKPRNSNIVCFTCSKEGHISSKCPERDSKQESSSKTPGGVAKSKNLTKNSVVGVPDATPKDNTLEVLVSGRSLRMLPDSGAQISVVPPAFVAECEYTGESTCLVDFEGQGDRSRRVALVKITVGNQIFSERVAVSSHVGMTGILSVPFVNKSKCAWVLEEFYRQQTRETETVAVVTTRAEKKKALQEEEREQEAMLADGVSTRDANNGVFGKEPNHTPDHRSGKQGSNVLVEMVHDGVVPAQQSSSVPEETVHDRVGSALSECMEDVLDTTLPGEWEQTGSMSGEGMHVGYGHDSNSSGLTPVNVKTECNSGWEEFQIECLKGGSDRGELIELIKSDASLGKVKKLASQKLRGYSWENGLLIHRYVNEIGDEVQRLVIPKQKRELVCELAHDRMGHLGHRKLRDIVGKRFTWPRVGSDLETYVQSCESCQMATKRGQRKVPLVERPILSEPFEATAVDIVGPFPMAKGRARYLLTAVCLATRWPEAITLKSVTAKSVAEGLISIFSRTGLPYVLLCDNGSQFTGKLMGELASTLGVEVKHSSPYHPEANGMVERMHSTLGAMLRKAGEAQMDWAEQVPFALFALRQMPNRSTGLSPYELVWGSAMRTPLDVLYRGWRNKASEKLNVSEWTRKLCERLEILRDIAVSNAKDGSEYRKTLYDRGKVDRAYSLGDKVLVRVAGMHGKLSDSWEGPFEVIKILSRVNYKVKECEGKRVRNVHVNLCKTWRDRKKVSGVTILAKEEDVPPENGVKLSQDVVESVLGEVMEVLEDYTDIMDGEPGCYTGDPLSVSVVEGAVPVSTKPYRIPEAIKPKVKDALDNLIERGWVVRSSSPWASPIVPVAKPDGSVRLCINYKRLNDLTQQQQYPIPHFEDILSEVGQAKVLSKMDLMKGYHQVPLTQECQNLTGFVTPWGSFKFTVLPFGLKNAPAQFQQLMVEVLAGCVGFALVYIDDVLVFSEDIGDHANHVRLVLDAIRASGLKLNPKKCAWARSKVEFLGHVVGEGSISVPEARVKALKDFVKPVTRRDLRAALGTFGYYRKFIPKYADITTELNRATSSKATHRVQWTPEMTLDFGKLKNAVCDVSMLCVPCKSDVFVLHTDASGRGIGAVLYVVREGAELPVAFYSKPVRGAEERYSATELEALAIVRGVEHFIPYLYGRTFEVVTDHAPLCGLMTSPHLNRRLRGFMLKLLEFDLHITYRPGEENGDADGLSRQAWRTEDMTEVSSGSSLSGPACISEGGDVGTPTQEESETPPKGAEE